MWLVSNSGTRNKVWEKVKAGNQAASATDTSMSEQSLDLPLSIRHPRKARSSLRSWTLVEPLPASIAPVSIATELEITASLVSELNNSIQFKKTLLLVIGVLHINLLTSIFKQKQKKITRAT